MKPATVFRTFSPAEAYLVRSCLEAAGFHAVVTHDLSALGIEGYTLAAGGVRVEVPNVEADDAREFLDDTPPAG